MIRFRRPFNTWLHGGAVVLCSLAIAPAGAASGNGADPESAGAAAKAASALPAKPSRVIREGGVDRPLWIDPERVIEFNKPGASRPVIRPADSERAAAAGSTGTGDRAGKSDAGTAAQDQGQVSPLFLDETGQPRALPGGVIVALKQELPEAQARARLQDAGLSPLRRLGPRMWLVDSPAGEASLDLAERLGGDARFEFAEPNWWRPRRTK